MTFREMLVNLVSRHGQGTLAEKVGTGDSTLSRFRSGQGGLTIQVLENLLKEGQMVLVPVDEWELMKDGLALMSDLWRKERYNRPAMITKGE